MSVQDKRPVKVMLFGTHPQQFNGYSKVVYELCKKLSVEKERISISIFGFQNFHEQSTQHRTDLPANVDVYDAFANENPKSLGFGFGEVVDVVTLKRPDVLVIYNDMVVIAHILKALQTIPDKWFKTVLYIDQVYLSQKREFIDMINANADAAFAFTPYWKDCIVKQGLTLPCDVLEHGINPEVYYPIPKRVARTYFGLHQDDFIVLNLNRNQPRKRWDTCMKAFAHVIAAHKNREAGKPVIKFIIGTALKGAWDLIEIFERELLKRGITLQEGMKHLIIIDNPQKLTDHEINVLYNASDCGINTADGEGVGLCSVEPGVIGVPQIVPRLGGFIDFFDDESAIMVEPTMAYYVDASRDMVGGEALMCDYGDFADAIEMYYENPALRVKHGAAARQKILVPHLWQGIASHFIDIVEKVHSGMDDIVIEEPAPQVIEPVTQVIEPIAQTDTSSPTVPNVPNAVPNLMKKVKDKGGNKKRKNAKQDINQLLQLRAQIDALLLKSVSN
ncbi:D-inositol 3-phosphate glycosyltransferase [Tetrabaena socialis]|uniref:D-inositol 3-phosphate glycosyltransferase n=1 Tax=Tetrabaena socialis TaxID=47790 RepID=A0A2J8AJ64_9CHLO|nr:D-inositol 3-phosphate glycosyltransferase [Tetrabaena socialis]|eukprot:PNH12551.1 D-inositol 3-phosphate glycosyltransferase [Tetrabaena socialis]